MKKGIIISFLAVILASQCLAQTDRDITVAGPFENISFSMFAGQLSSRYNIRIYYRDDWVKDISVNLPGDTITLRQALHTILDPHGIRYFDRGNGQIYLTGETDMAETRMAQTTLPEQEPDRKSVV